MKVQGHFMKAHFIEIHQFFAKKSLIFFVFRICFDGVVIAAQCTATFSDFSNKVG